MFVLLAPYDHEQSDLMHRVYEEKKLDHLPKYKYVFIFDKYKKQLQKIERKVGMEYQKAYKQGYIVRMVTKVKDRPYFFLSSVFGCLFTSYFLPVTRLMLFVN